MSLKAPWKVLRQRDDREFLEVADEAGITQIAEVWGPHRVGRARMIAAAPELYAALQSTLALARLKWGNLDQDANSVFADAEAALSKACGKVGAEAPSHGQRRTGAATLQSNEAAQPNSNPEGFQ